LRRGRGGLCKRMGARRRCGRGGCSEVGPGGVRRGPRTRRVTARSGCPRFSDQAKPASLRVGDTALRRFGRFLLGPFACDRARREKGGAGGGGRGDARGVALGIACRLAAVDGPKRRRVAGMSSRGEATATRRVEKKRPPRARFWCPRFWRQEFAISKFDLHAVMDSEIGSHIPNVPAYPEACRCIPKSIAREFSDMIFGIHGALTVELRDREFLPRKSGTLKNDGGLSFLSSASGGHGVEVSLANPTASPGRLAAPWAAHRAGGGVRAVPRPAGPYRASCACTFVAMRPERSLL
jgi:hypothetical protein